MTYPSIISNASSSSSSSLVDACHGGAILESNVRDRHTFWPSAAFISVPGDCFVQSLTLSIQAFHCLPLLHLPSVVPWRMFLDRVSWRLSWPYQGSFHCFTTGKSGGCSLARALTCSFTHSLVLCSVMVRTTTSYSFYFQMLGSNSALRVQFSQP